MVMNGRTVACAVAPGTGYGPCEAVAAPELPGGAAADTALVTLRNLLLTAGLDLERAGTSEWNPLGEVVNPGDSVVIKPNWVLHQNSSRYGLDCLVTHTSVLAAIMMYLGKARPAEVVIGDAPLQGCDFDALAAEADFEQLRHVSTCEGIPVSIRDFRRKVLVSSDGSGKQGDPVVPTSRTDADYRVVDLGHLSVLEPISDPGAEFRVTMYNPDALKEKHRAGRHQYLVAHEVLDADVIINVPKLKTHMKAGVTGALKNMVGMNGLKDYLPHHRKGGADAGGDCYAGHSKLKAIAEDLLDASNRTERLRLRRGLNLLARATARASTAFGHASQLEGGWFGNDTVWRMCLDLQRILHYALADGTIGNTLARRVVSITDGIIAGDGDGPLFPEPVDLGLLTFSTNVAAAELVHTALMRFNPDRIPLVREAFAPHDLPLSTCEAEAVDVLLPSGERTTPDQLPDDVTRAFRPPAGWIGHCERGQVTSV